MLEAWAITEKQQKDEERARAREAKATQGKATTAGFAIATTIHQHHNAPSNMASYRPMDEVV